jgi:hypothetical protein
LLTGFDLLTVYFSDLSPQKTTRVSTSAEDFNRDEAAVGFAAAIFAMRRE